MIRKNMVNYVVFVLYLYKHMNHQRFVNQRITGTAMV